MLIKVTNKVRMPHTSYYSRTQPVLECEACVHVFWKEGV